MEDFDSVGRSSIGWDYSYTIEGDQIEHAYMKHDSTGDYVQYYDYERLLKAYKELKFRMEGLEK